MRFFAVTPHRLQLAAASRLPSSAWCVWSWVELNASPARPATITLPTIARALGLSVPTVTRALQRLVDLGLVVRRILSHGLQLAPAGGPSDSIDHRRPAPATPSESIDQPGPGLSPVINHPAAGLSTVINHDGANARPASSGAPSPENVRTENVKPITLDAGPDAGLPARLAALGVYPGKARALIQAHGAARVADVAAWTEWQGASCRNPVGYLLGALAHGWGPPAGYAAQQAVARDATAAGLPAPAPRSTRDRSDVEADLCAVQWRLKQTGQLPDNAQALLAELRQHDGPRADRWALALGVVHAAAC